MRFVLASREGSSLPLTSCTFRCPGFQCRMRYRETPSTGASSYEELDQQAGRQRPKSTECHALSSSDVLQRTDLPWSRSTLCQSCACGSYRESNDGIPAARREQQAVRRCPPRHSGRRTKSCPLSRPTRSRRRSSRLRSRTRHDRARGRRPVERQPVAHRQIVPLTECAAECLRDGGRLSGPPSRQVRAGESLRSCQFWTMSRDHLTSWLRPPSSRALERGALGHQIPKPVSVSGCRLNDVLRQIVGEAFGSRHDSARNACPLPPFRDPSGLRTAMRLRPVELHSHRSIVGGVGGYIGASRSRSAPSS